MRRPSSLHGRRPATPVLRESVTRTDPEDVSKTVSTTLVPST
jgi:hypothetical protein